jgi:hypothetical protein
MSFKLIANILGLAAKKKPKLFKPYMPFKNKPRPFADHAWKTTKGFTKQEKALSKAEFILQRAKKRKL